MFRFRFFPNSFYMRMIILILLPVVLVQFVVYGLFYGNLWDIVLRRLSRAVASEVSIVVKHHRYFRNVKDRDWSIETVRAETGYGIEFFRDGKIPNLKPPSYFGYGKLEQNLNRQLDELLSEPFHLSLFGKPGLAIIDVQLEDGYLEFQVPISRLYTSSSWVVLVWMSGSSVLFLLVTSWFLRNQIKPIRVLAKAARDFGENKPDAELQLRGSNEIREATHAFMVMRQDIRRNVRERTEMLSAASHDLRTPLTRMKLNIELLDLGQAGEGLKQDIADMERLIAAYLDFLRGQGDEMPSEIDLADFLTEIKQNAQRSGLLVENATAISQKINAEKSQMIKFRQLAMKRVFDNLISNAVRHATKISISYKWVGNRLVLYFDDNGAGIPPGKRALAFEPFSRLESSRNHDTGGYGLGLTLVRNVVEAHQGQVSLHDSPMGGLRVEISLPQGTKL